MKDVAFEEGRAGSGELEPREFPGHRLVRRINGPVPMEIWRGGRFVSWEKRPDQFSVTPAGATVGVRWSQDHHFLVATLAPSLVASILLEAAEGRSVGLVERHGCDDPHARHLMLALRADAEDGHSSGRLYTDVPPLLAPSGLAPAHRAQGPGQPHPLGQREDLHRVRQIRPTPRGGTVPGRGGFMNGAVLVLLTCVLCGCAEDDSLRGRIEALIAPFGDKVIVEVAFRDLETSETCLIRADEPIHPASTMKVPVMLEVYRQANEGKLSLDDRLPIKIEFASIVDGSPFALDPKDDSELALYKRVGELVTIRELVRLMITESSNVATNMLVEKVSPTSTTIYMKELGADGLKVLRGVEDNKAYAKGMNNVATARSLMMVLARLAEGSAVSKVASDEMLGVLRGQKFNEGIPAGLPKGTTVAHKTGSFQGVYHDVGIVEVAGRKPFVLVVLTRGIAEEPKAHKLVAGIARLAFEQVTRAKEAPR
jgi:beta-lactamase class A